MTATVAWLLGPHLTLRTLCGGILAYLKQPLVLAAIAVVGCIAWITWRLTRALAVQRADAIAWYRDAEAQLEDYLQQEADR
jgi:hypothetical protein